MKNQEDNIAQEVEKTLSSIDRRQRLEANPYLYGKVKERLAGQSDAIGFPLFFANKLQPVFFVILLLVNAYVGYAVFNTTNSSEGFLETLAEEYNLENNELTSSDVFE